MLFLNYEGLTYRWNYSHTVSVFDNGIEVDSFSIGYTFPGETPDYPAFLEGVVNWAKYISDAAYYTSENAF